jgi:hypothetical protein
VAYKAPNVPLQWEWPFLGPVDCEDSEATVIIVQGGDCFEQWGLPELVVVVAWRLDR